VRPSGVAAQRELHQLRERRVPFELDAEPLHNPTHECTPAPSRSTNDTPSRATP
jgi:hypothetical protein